MGVTRESREAGGAVDAVEGGLRSGGRAEGQGGLMESLPGVQDDDGRGEGGRGAFPLSGCQEEGGGRGGWGGGGRREGRLALNLHIRQGSC